MVTRNISDIYANPSYYHDFMEKFVIRIAILPKELSEFMRFCVKLPKIHQKVFPLYSYYITFLACSKDFFVV